jgi:plasmid maintenance system antidote protein VapI
MLNKRIQDLQNSRIEFARMIKELNVSIIKAESNVNEMSELSKITGNEIKSVVEEARAISSELVTLSSSASDVAAKLKNDLQNALDNTEASSASSQFESTANSSKNDNSAAMAQEKFTEDDLAPIDDDNSKYSKIYSDDKYTDHLKRFFNTIVSKDGIAQSANLNQTSYYDTLRKINIKK